MQRRHLALLDLIARRPDPVTWYGVRLSSMTLEQNHQVFCELVDMGLVRDVGIRKDVWEDGERHKDVIYGVTRRGLEEWERHRHKLPPTAGQLAGPKYSTARLAVASAPTDVFDLARAPWRHKLRRDLE